MFRTEEIVEKLDIKLGEILMSTAEVKIKDKLGFVMIMVMDEEKAINCAIIVAVYELDNEDKKTIEEKASTNIIGFFHFQLLKSFYK